MFCKQMTLPFGQISTQNGFWWFIEMFLKLRYDSQTDKQTIRHAEIQIDRCLDSQRDRWKQDIQQDRQTERRKSTLTDTHIEKQKDRHTQRRKEVLIDTQIDRKIDRQRDEKGY